MRTARCLVLAAVLGVGSAGAAPEWQALPGAPVSGRFDDLCFLDATQGWVCDGGGRVFHTADGGVSWELLRDGTEPYLRAIRFSDPQHGWVGTLFSDTILYRTTNGGLLWTGVVDIPEPRPNAICGLSVASSQVIYGVGSFSGPGRVIKSSDGGATWTSKDLDPLANTLVDVYFRSATEGFAVGSIGQFPNGSRAVVLATTDGGDTWQQRFVGSRLGEWGWKISFPTPLIGYVSLEREAGPMFFLKTEDGGQTWTELPFPNYNEQGIGFVTPGIGWVGGAGNPTFGTTDGGATWTQTPWGYYLNRFQFLSPTLGYGCGVTIYRYSESLVAVPPVAPAPPEVRAGPSPFAQRTSIRFTLDRTQHVELLVADPAGRVVRTLVSGTLAAGPHVVEWDGMDRQGSPAPAGIYLYVLHAGEQHKMGKLVRVR